MTIPHMIETCATKTTPSRGPAASTGQSAASVPCTCPGATILFPPPHLPSPPVPHANRQRHVTPGPAPSVLLPTQFSGEVLPLTRPAPSVPSLHRPVAPYISEDPDRDRCSLLLFHCHLERVNLTAHLHTFAEDCVHTETRAQQTQTDTTGHRHTGHRHRGHTHRHRDAAHRHKDTGHRHTYTQGTDIGGTHTDTETPRIDTKTLGTDTHTHRAQTQTHTAHKHTAHRHTDETWHQKPRAASAHLWPRC